MTEYITVSPAYGVDYKNKSNAVQDWRAGKDFVLESNIERGGTYCSNRDFPANSKITIRYDRKRSCVIISN